MGYTMRCYIPCPWRPFILWDPYITLDAPWDVPLDDNFGMAYGLSFIPWDFASDILWDGYSHGTSYRIPHGTFYGTPRKISHDMFHETCYGTSYVMSFPMGCPMRSHGTSCGMSRGISHGTPFGTFHGTSHGASNEYRMECPIRVSVFPWEVLKYCCLLLCPLSPREAFGFRSFYPIVIVYRIIENGKHYRNAELFSDRFFSSIERYIQTFGMQIWYTTYRLAVVHPFRV